MFAKLRVVVFLITIVVVASVGYVVSLYARGYRLNTQTYKFEPNGLLVIKSDPDGAQVYIDGELETATNANITLAPGTFDVTVHKDDYISWNKRLTIEKEVVTEVTAHLFRTAPSLSALTFTSILNPVPSKDLTKIAYAVPSSTNGNNQRQEGLWIMEMVNLPLGFTRDPRRITDGDLTDAAWRWSPDGREILLTTETGSFLLDTGTFTPQQERINVAATREEILESWEEEFQKRLDSQLGSLPDELEDILQRKSSSVVFSPDEDMVLYTASGSAQIPNNLKKQLPGSSTQKQERDIKPSKTYIYDIEEDRNFAILEDSSDVVIEGGYPASNMKRLSWLPTSRHVVLAQEGEIIISDYDGTNRRTVYSGSYVAPHAYPTLTNDRLLLLTNLGASSSPLNLYSVSIK